ncbi:GntR family transcriptional regulator [Pseudomonas asiatica]|uniref:GntR family transcriptional regulator n=1 Tax=Pseudomonas asiatica TaxID=2219225 RepID=UPI0018AAA82C|nr:GntR family transcriptional regulator [Pseudomonas asiatica]MBF8803515.1 GntR family transcriptional regulator [Pseudomonas asiatica]
MESRKRVIQSDLLRNQVYKVIMEDIRNGTFGPGQRLVELELAGRYGVSRTPVREALFQLAREGIIVNSERGYCLPVDSENDFLDRLAVRLTLDSTLAAYAAARATEDELYELGQHYSSMKTAHEAGRFASFAEHAHHFRVTLIQASHNVTLERVCRVLEDQFLMMRNELYKDEFNRQTALDFDGRLLETLLTRDGQKSAAIAREYMVTLITRFSGEPVDSISGVLWVAPAGVEKQLANLTV